MRNGSSTRKTQVIPWRNSWIASPQRSGYQGPAPRGHHRQQLSPGSTSFPATELAAPSNNKKPAAETSGKRSRTRKEKLRGGHAFFARKITAWNCRLKLQSRKAAAEKRNLCLSCLRPQHAKPGDCKYFRKVCLECSATHHPLLCPARDKLLKSAACERL